jgi:NAD+ kinase
MIWFYPKPNGALSEALVARLTAFLSERGIECARFDAPASVGADDLIVVLGGDGTLIHGAQRFADRGAAVLAINLGRLGYLTPFSSEGAEQAVLDALAGRLREEMRMRLSVAVRRADGETIEFNAVLNEATVTSHQPARICSLTLSVDGQPLTSLRGDGVLVATPTGSTAYALSCGGPVLMPGLRCMVVVPVAPHSFSFRPLVLHPDQAVSIRLDDPGWLVLDGQTREALRAGDEVTVGAASVPLRLLAPLDHDHLQTLSAKLHWGKGPT